MVEEGNVVHLVTFDFLSVFRHVFKINFLLESVVLDFEIIHLVRAHIFQKTNITRTPEAKRTLKFMNLNVL